MSKPDLHLERVTALLTVFRLHTSVGASQLAGHLAEMEMDDVEEWLPGALTQLQGMGVLVCTKERYTLTKKGFEVLMPGTKPVRSRKSASRTSGGRR